MTIFDTVKGTVNTAVDTISSVAQSLVEKNRANAKLNRLRLVMKSESELMNRAYIALGKQYYEKKKKNEPVSVQNEEKLFEVIEKSKAKIAKARECYRNIVDSQNDIYYGSVDCNNFNTNDVVDITVACSNEEEYKSSPFENTEAKSATTVKELQEQLDAVDKKTSGKANELEEELVCADESTKDCDDESPDGELF